MNANLIHIDAKGKASLIIRGQLVTAKKEFNEFQLKAGEELELVGIGIDPKRRGGSRDVTAYLATVAKENSAKLEKLKQSLKPSAKQTVQEIEKTTGDIDSAKSADVNRIKSEQAKKFGTTPKQNTITKNEK